jgi:hypothetical protein
MERAAVVPPGTRFGKLVVLGEAQPVRYGNQPPSRALTCQCDCGKIAVVTVRKLLHQGQVTCSRSCGQLKHGMARRGNRDPIYNCWQSILARCENPKATGYKYWGGRGIKVYGPWHDPLVFKADVEREIGPRPSVDFTIERVDVDSHYEPGKIAWLPKSQQPLNRRRQYNSTEVAELLAQYHCPGCQCSEQPL